MHRWEDNIKMNLREIQCGYVLDWTDTVANFREHRNVLPSSL